LKYIISVKESSDGKRGEIQESKKDGRFKGLMDVLKLKHHHDVAATIEKLHIEVEFVAFAKLDAISRANEVDLKLFLKRLHDGRS
jgi:hypothetical protein